MWEVFLVQRRERSSVGWLFLLSLLSGIPQIATMTAASTLVVNVLAPEELPRLILASGIVIGVVAATSLLALGRMSARGRALALALFLLVGTAGILAFAWSGAARVRVAVAFYVWTRVENVLLAVILLTAANSLLAPRASRRTLGFATTGQVISLIAGSAAIPILLRIIDVEDLVALSVAAHAGIALHIWRSNLDARRHPPDVSSRDADRDRRRKRLERPLTVSMMLLIAAMYVAYYVTDAGFLAGLNGEFRDPTEIARYIARFWLVIGVLVLFFKLVLTGRLLSRFGLAFGLLAAPVAMILAFGGGFTLLTVRGPLLAVVLAKAVERVLDAGLFLPSFYGLFQGFSARTRTRNQFLAEPLMGQSIASIAGFLLVLLRQSESYSVQTNILLGAAVALVWAIFGIVAIRRYGVLTLALIAPARQEPWPGPPTESPSDEGAGVPKAVSRQAVDEQLLLAGHLQLEAHSANENDGGSPWAPLVDAIKREKNKAVDEAARLLGKRAGSYRLADSIVRMRRLPDGERERAIDGLAPSVDQRWRWLMLSVLESDDPFLVQRAINRIAGPAGEDSPFARSSEWTKEVLAASGDPNTRSRWEAQRRDVLYLQSSELFSGFSLEELSDLARNAERQDYNAGTLLMREGDPGDSMQLIVDGTVRVQRAGTELATLGPGRSVGELSALFPERRSASVVTTTDATTLTLTRKALWRFLRENPSALIVTESIIRERVRERLASTVGTSARDAEITPLAVQKIDPFESRRIIENLSIFSDLTAGGLDSAAANIMHVDLPRGERFACPADTGILLADGVVAEYAGGDPTIRVHAGAPVAALPWTGFADLPCWGVAQTRARLVVVPPDTYSALLTNSVAFHIHMLYALVTLSRSLSLRAVVARED